MLCLHAPCRAEAHEQPAGQRPPSFCRQTVRRSSGSVCCTFVVQLDTRAVPLRVRDELAHVARDGEQDVVVSARRITHHEGQQSCNIVMSAVLTERCLTALIRRQSIIRHQLGSSGMPMLSGKSSTRAGCASFYVHGGDAIQVIKKGCTHRNSCSFSSASSMMVIRSTLPSRTGCWLSAAAARRRRLGGFIASSCICRVAWCTRASRSDLRADTDQSSLPATGNSIMWGHVLHGEPSSHEKQPSRFLPTLDVQPNP